MASNLGAIIGGIAISLFVLWSLYLFFKRRLPQKYGGGLFGFLRNLGALYMAQVLPIIYVPYAILSTNPNASLAQQKSY